ncbi:MAG: methylated-DNA--[protein]-cysteine S-methyltransferase [Pseudomonadota bacterium]
MQSVEVKIAYFNPIVGWLEIKADDYGVNDISFVERPEAPQRPSSHPILEACASELDDYFSSRSLSFATPLHFTRGTPFQVQVWNELLKIPAGETRSYSQIAQNIGHPKATRAVGSANGKNPIPILVPCHRVINSNGSLGGYSSGVKIKKALLNLEKKFEPSVPKEIEAKLIIFANYPGVIKEISTLDSISDLKLGPICEDVFEDTYFDLPGGVLSGVKWAVRSRRYHDKEIMAFKGPALGTEEGALERPEHEIDWDFDSPQKISSFLENLKISVNFSPAGDFLNPEKFLQTGGFYVIQRRQTTRITRKVFAKGNPNPVAEMAIDSVLFTVGPRRLHHYEIEIESLSQFDHSPIKEALSFLIERFSSSVTPWKYDKLTTVGVIIEMIKSGTLQGISSYEYLEKSAYDQVLARLEEK